MLNLHETISERSHSISESDLKQLLLAYQDAQDLHLYEVLEQRMIVEVKKKQISIETVAEVLYEYSKNRVGSSSLISVLLAFIDQQGDSLTKMADKDTLLSVLMSLNLCGHVDSTQFALLAKYFVQNKEKLSGEEIAIVEAAGI